MGVYSEMAADLRDDVQEHTTTVQDAAELAARRADERQQAEEEQARAMLSQMQQNADAAPAAPDPEAEKKAEEDMNIRNGMNFAKKVLSTGECNLLILDEVLGLIEKNIISVEDVENLLNQRGETDVILTGISLNDEICSLADEVSKIETLKFKTYNF